MINNIKKGDKVVIYCEDSRYKDIYEVTVKSVGPKYIKVEGVTKDMDVYGRDSLMCTKWQSWRLAPYPTVEDYKMALEEKLIKKGLISELHKYLNIYLETLPIEKIQKLINRYKKKTQ